MQRRGAGPTAVLWTIAGILLLSGSGLQSAQAQYYTSPTIGRYGGAAVATKTSGAVTTTSGAVTKTSGAVTSGAVTRGLLEFRNDWVATLTGRRPLSVSQILPGFTSVQPFLPASLRPKGSADFVTFQRKLHATPSSGAVTKTSGAITKTSGAVTSGAVLARPGTYGAYGRRMLAGYEAFLHSSGLLGSTPESQLLTVTLDLQITYSGGYVNPTGLTVPASSVGPPPSSPKTTTSGGITSGAVTSGAVTSGAVTSGAVTSGARTVPGSYFGGNANTRAPLRSKPGFEGCLTTPLTVLESDPDLAIFTQLLKMFGLDRAIDTTSMFITVFAPTNAAIIAAGVDPRDTMTTTSILENHIVLGSRLASSLASPQIQKTLSGSFVTIDPVAQNPGGIRISSGSGLTAVTATSNGPPLLSCLGEIYVIDRVLPPTTAFTG